MLLLNYVPSGVNLADFTYNGKFSENISRLLYEEALKVKFFGLSVSENYTRPFCFKCSCIQYSYLVKLVLVLNIVGKKNSM